jgi:hypothetical protein
MSPATPTGTFLFNCAPHPARPASTHARMHALVRTWPIHYLYNAPLPPYGPRLFTVYVHACTYVQTLHMSSYTFTAISYTCIRGRSCLGHQEYSRPFTDKLSLLYHLVGGTSHESSSHLFSRCKPDDHSWPWTARPENPEQGWVGLACWSGFGPEFGARTSGWARIGVVVNTI